MLLFVASQYLIDPVAPERVLNCDLFHLFALGLLVSQRNTVLLAKVRDVLHLFWFLSVLSARVKEGRINWVIKFRLECFGLFDKLVLNISRVEEILRRILLFKAFSQIIGQD